MEKDLFPLRQTDLPPSALSRMDGMADGGCGCTEELTNGDRRGCRGHEGCGADSWGLSEYPLAMVYAPCQAFRGLYDPQNALSRGTLFSELDLPLGRRECGLTTACSCRGERRPT